MDDLSDTDAIVLAGGQGARLRSVVSDRPKVLADVAGRPFLAHLLDLLHAAGVRRAVLSVGYKGEMVRQAFGTRHGSMTIAYGTENEPLGTGGGARRAAGAVRSEPVLVLNGDSYCGLDLPAFVRSHRASACRGTLAVLRLDDTARFGRVTLDADRVARFEEKSGGEPGLINAGVYALSPSLLNSIPEGRAVSLENEMFPSWVAGGLHAFVCHAPFLDVGTPESYALAERFFAGLRS